MSSDPGAGAPVRDLESLHRRVDELTDLFRRRLVEDREKSKAIALLQQQLDESKPLARLQLLEPIVRQLLLVLDRLDAAEPDATAFQQSIAAEIGDALAQYGVVRIETQGYFDPATMEGWAVKPTEDPEWNNVVASVERAGYRWPIGLLRPAAVTVWRLAP